MSEKSWVEQQKWFEEAAYPEHQRFFKASYEKLGHEVRKQLRFWPAEVTGKIFLLRFINWLTTAPLNQTGYEYEPLRTADCKKALAKEVPELKRLCAAFRLSEEEVMRLTAE